ncbi:MAG: hypothetical protein R2941_14525 [Desulfobacterales bacterium]
MGASPAVLWPSREKIISAHPDAVHGADLLVQAGRLLKKSGKSSRVAVDFLDRKNCN